MEKVINEGNWRELLPKRQDDSNKGTFGKVLVIAGSYNMCGAAYFAGCAAYRAGAGLVYILTEECNRVILQQRLPEAVLLTYTPERLTSDFIRNALAGKDAVVIGPGLGLGADKELLLQEVLLSHHPRRALDADALNLLARNPLLWRKNTRPLIITPHMGEMSRLTGESVADIKKDPIETARNFSRTHGIVTVLKDHHTLISNGIDHYVNQTGNHGMATGGSGDVLTGIIGGLLAQKMDLFEAATLGCYLHGAAGDMARDRRGAYAMMAGDLLDYILYKEG